MIKTLATQNGRTLGAMSNIPGIIMMKPPVDKSVVSAIKDVNSGKGEDVPAEESRMEVLKTESQTETQTATISKEAVTGGTNSEDTGSGNTLRKSAKARLSATFSPLSRLSPVSIGSNAASRDKRKMSTGTNNTCSETDEAPYSNTPDLSSNNTTPTGESKKEKRLSRQMLQEEKRLEKEKQKEEQRIAKEKEAEEKRIAKEKEAEEKRLQKEKEAEEKRIAKEKEKAEKEREKEEKRLAKEAKEKEKREAKEAKLKQQNGESIESKPQHLDSVHEEEDDIVVATEEADGF